MSDDIQVVREIAATSVKELFEILSPRGDVLWGHGPYSWIFRGHGASEFALLPTAFRPDRRTKLEKHSDFDLSKIGNTVGRQVALEVSAITGFIGGANEVGLPLPGFRPEDQIKLCKIEAAISSYANSNVMPNSIEIWPDPNLLPILAVARHAGLTTRLLDWTFSARIAAYFAAASALRTPRKSSTTSDQLVIWGLYQPCLSAGLGIDFPEPGEVYAVPVIYEPNRNMFAQEGAMTINPTLHFEWSRPCDFAPIDALINANQTRFTERAAKYDRQFDRTTRYLMLKVTLPVAKAPELLLELRRERISHHRLFPNYAGVVDSLEEMAELPTPIPLEMPTETSAKDRSKKS